MRKGETGEKLGPSELRQVFHKWGGSEDLKKQNKTKTSSLFLWGFLTCAA